MRVIDSRVLAMVALMVAGGMMQGCGHELFSDSDSRTQQTLRYYNNDSATQTTEARKQSAGSPFGMPQGGPQQ
ncbi:MAG TPA: hypothetical protein VM008_10600 [Phycisphaerae bacterium]|nr:hypothetical protein [Phycisphaerae bacterium]